MTAEEIKTQAEAYADRIDDGNRTARQCAVKAYCKGYADGIENRKREIWHSPDEQPQRPDKGIIIVTRIRRRFIHATANGDWQKKIKAVNALKWAYKEDLL